MSKYNTLKLFRWWVVKHPGPRTAGLDVEITEVAPGRPNVVAVLEGRRPGQSLMLCGHTDTVGVVGIHRLIRWNVMACFTADRANAYDRSR